MPADKIIITSRFADGLIAPIAPHARIIMGSDPAKGMPRAEILARVGEIPGRLRMIWAQSSANGLPPSIVADRIAQGLIGRGA